MATSSTTPLPRLGDRLRVALLGLLAERLRRQRIDRVVEVAVDFRDQAANERARAHVAGKERRSGRGNASSSIRRSRSIRTARNRRARSSARDAAD
jgi:hypothetical protein